MVVRTHWCSSLTQGDAAGQGGALRLTSGGGVAFHNTVVQEVAGARVGEGSALELHCVHLVDEAVRTEGDMVSPGVLQCSHIHFHLGA